MGRPTVFPTGATVYDPDKCQNGYTVFGSQTRGTIVLDMNGKIVHLWKNFGGFPSRVIPGGHCFGIKRMRDRGSGYQDAMDLTEVDWSGNVEWTYDHNQLVTDEGIGEHYVARQHHDYQIEGSPVGYVSPGQDPKQDFNKVLILTHDHVSNPRISPQLLLEDRLIEVDREGNLLWEWNELDHFNEFHITEAQKNVMYRDPNTQVAAGEGEGDIFHTNTCSYLGPNKWFDQGDMRFKPDNIICDSREANIMWILDHDTGKIVWQIGPDFTQTRELRLMRCLIGMHHAHMIPEGLPGEGNILVFDNGGWAGYGLPSQESKFGLKAERRDFSRVLEFNPITLKVVWEFNAKSLGDYAPFSQHHFYSALVSSAQRLQNGNTLITEGCSGRFLEVTPEGELVWEYNYPDLRGGLVYRAYRIPYEWLPQLDKPTETPILKSTTWISRFRCCKTDFDENAVEVPEAYGYTVRVPFCVEKVDSQKE